MASAVLDTVQYPTSTSGYRLKLAYDYSNNLLQKVRDFNGSTIFWQATSTDAWGHIQDETFGNGVATFTDFDQASGLMTAREGGIGGGTGLIQSQLSWDLNGNLKQRKDLKLSPSVTEDFYYDALNRFDYSQRTPAGGATSTNADVMLDEIGNISWKLGVGTYAYHATRKRAVVTAGSNSYGYDANGNMTSRNGASIGYTSYNLPDVINAPGSYSSTISYGAFRNRFKQVAIGPSGTETTIYVAGLLEKVTNGTGTHYRHYIQGGAGTAAIHSRTVGGSNLTFYLHRDHLGSPELITDGSGNALVRPSFAAYGERRDGTDWDGPIGSGDLNTLAGISRRGFTGHEHLDSVGLIHMNGRVYEPVAGRFLSRDPFIDGVGSSQGPNGYAYVHNSPLTYIDPSGYGQCTPDQPQNCAQGPDWGAFYWRYVRESFDWLQELTAAQGGGAGLVPTWLPRVEWPTVGGGHDRVVSYDATKVRYGVNANSSTVGGSLSARNYFGTSSADAVRQRLIAAGAFLGGTAGAVVAGGCTAGSGGVCALGAPAIITGGAAGGAVAGAAIAKAWEQLDNLFAKATDESLREYRRLYRVIHAILARNHWRQKWPL